MITRKGISARTAAIITAPLLALLMFHIDAPDPSGKGPVRYCYATDRPGEYQWDCFLPGDVPQFVVDKYGEPVWVGHEADIPRPK